jgi:SAM-dependent methyltransferase
VTFVDRINQEYFEGELSPEVLELLAPLDDERDEVHQWVERMARLMRHQHFDARNFHHILAWLLGEFLGKILPGAWGGAVPPITLEGRHARVDDYLAGNRWRPLVSGDRFLDMGCGFPPMTTMDSSRRFPDIQITGADPSFGRYLVRHTNGDYAAFTASHEVLYFQCGSNEADRWDALFSDPEATRSRFRAVLMQALPGLPGDADTFGAVTSGEYTVSENPVLEYHDDGLVFHQQGIGSTTLGTFDVLRCFNVLCYFDNEFREKAIEWAGDLLEEGGIFLTGMNWTHSRHARYSLYRSEGGVMVQREYAFSVENLRALEMVPWFTLHDDDYCTGTLSELVRTVRSNDDFRMALDTRVDEVLDEVGILMRGQDGYLGGIDESADPERFDTISEVVGGTLEGEGFNQRAADVLTAAGFTAWINCVGHIAIDPAGLA